MKTIKLWFLKRRLKSAYLKYINDKADYGASLQDYVSGSRLECNEIIAKINELDPSANLSPIGNK